MGTAEEVVKGVSEQVLFCPDEHVQSMRGKGQSAANYYAALRKVRELTYEDLPEDWRVDND